MNIFISSLLFVSILFSNNADTLANQNTVSNDSLATLINQKLTLSTDSLAKLIDDKVNKVLDEVYYIDHLKNKVSGFEINPVLLLGALGDAFWFNANYSRFDISEKAEVVFPISIRQGDGTDWVMLDYQYRYFMGINSPREYRKGFFIMSGARASYSKELNENNNSFGIGVYAGIGSRRFGEKIYWGWNVLAGRYLNHDRVIFNFEFLKFGWYIK
tara:strand:+ start:2321 stop:2965 length:645 start_codon:yes stop_codon:yes gene_type:complete